MAKRIFIATSGSRGDVEPYIALGKALRSAGYDVLLAAPPEFSDWIASHGVTPYAAGAPVAEQIREFAGALENNGFFRAAATEKYKRLFLEAFANLAEVSKGADLLIYSPLQASLSCLCEVRNTPAILASLQPAFPTSEFAVPLQPRYSYGRILNRLSFHVLDVMMWTMFRSWWNDARQILGLKPLGRLHDIRTANGRPVPVLIAASEAMVPRPRDWPDYVHLTGNWFPDDGEWTPQPGLASFLAGGSPPLYVGFGSMPLGRMKKRAPVLVEALRRSGERAVFARGWGGWSEDLLASLGNQIHIIDRARTGTCFR